MSAEQPAKRRRASQLGLLSPAGTPLPPPKVTPPPAPEPMLDGEPIPKPDVFEFFAQRASKQRELESEMLRLQQREAQLAARLEDAELQVSQLRVENRSISARQEVREAQLEMQLREQQEALRREVERSAGLASRLRAAEEAAQAAAAQRRAGSPAAQAEADATSSPSQATQQLQLQVTQLQLQLEQVQADREEDARRAAAVLTTAHQQRDAEAAAARMLQQQLEEAVGLAEAATRQKHALESSVAELECSMVQLQGQLAEARASEGDAVLVRSLREQLREQEALVAEARRLKEQEINVHVLREQLEAAEARCRRAEEMLPAMAELQGQVADLEQQLGRWRLILGGAADCSTPEDVLHLMKTLQEQQVAVVSAAGERADEVAALRAEVAAAGDACAEAEAAAAAAKAGAEEASASLARSERKLALLAKERDGLKAILASYDEEYLNQNGSDLGPQQTRIVTLEAQVQALHLHVQSLESELASRSTASAGTAASAGQTLRRAEAAEARVRVLEAEAENLGRQVALLQERVGRGEYNPAMTRVLHFRHNPEAEVQRELRDTRVAELEAENGALREHITRLEAAAQAAAEQQQQGAAEGAPAAVPAAGSSMRVAQLEGETALLKRRVAELQKGAERLQQVFNKQITLFREAVFLLFGYRVEMATDPTAREFKAEFVLKPQHGEGGDASQLAFRLLRDGRMILVPTAYAQRLGREVETFIERFKSIPAFTANLTMELFQKQTQC